MSIVECVNELNAHGHAAVFATDAAFKNVGHAKRLGNFAKILRSFCAAITHHARPADDAKIFDSCERGQNVVLNSISEECVLLVRPHVNDRQYHDGFVGNAGTYESFSENEQNDNYA